MWFRNGEKNHIKSILLKKYTHINIFTNNHVFINKFNNLKVVFFKFPNKLPKRNAIDGMNYLLHVSHLHWNICGTTSFFNNRTSYNCECNVSNGHTCKPITAHFLVFRSTHIIITSFSNNNHYNSRLQK